METNPFDRLARWLRKPIIFALYAALPISILAFAGMWVLALESWPRYYVAAAFVSQFIVVLGIASLLDTRKETRQTQERDRQT